MPRPRKVYEQASAFAIRQVYRNLLRSIPPSVRFSRPAASNLRRLIRDDFKPSMDEQGTVDPVISKQDLHLKAQNTIALLLSSSYSPRLKSSPSSTTTTSQSSSKSSFKPQQLSHKLMSNLSSLTYHHLSPNTRMQPMSRTTGGSNLNTNLSSSNSNSKKKGGKTSKKRLAFLGSQKEELEEAEGEGSGIQNIQLEDSPSRPLPSLFFPAKPIRGPMTSPSGPNWDGQNPYKHSKNLSSQDVQDLEEKVGELAEKLKSLKSEGKEDSSLGKSVRKEFVEVRGTLKSKRGQILRERDISERNGKPIKLLDDLVKAVEETEKVWIGKTRWGKLKRNDWLEP